MTHKNPNLRSSLARRHRRKVFLIKTVAIFLLLVALFYFLSWTSKLELFQIENIEIDGNSVLSDSEISETIRNEMSGKYFFLFPKNSVFLHSKKNMEKKLLDEFKRIEKVKISRKGLNSLIIGIGERKPYSLWCAAEKSDSENSEKCYFLDKEGFVFSEAPKFSGNAFMRYYGLIDEGNPVGNNYMPAQKFKEVEYFINSLEALGMRAAEFRVNSENDYEILLEGGEKIIFDDRQSFAKTFENLQSILEETGLKKGSTTVRAKLDYVDLRFGNKVFYKFK